MKSNMDAIKKFAGNQFLNGDSTVSFQHKGTTIVNPWYDETGRFELNDEQAIAKYGAGNIQKFCQAAETCLIKQKNIMALDK